ncbi:BON domain-containing protein [Legionella waltersii]|uniref:Osmotically inducible protein Y n=1 Tax=Legionella waltersii TaxID=66969 RepID=A0A0W1A2B0_9GAMM|nr:BON domain-containing protein [Legionella waltersii]KTD75495.1 osmotically inducible protein Y [Legionella waltersii]SNU98326.1 osmotically inducible protein Y [Legionella waltersii]
MLNRFMCFMIVASLLHLGGLHANELKHIEQEVSDTYITTKITAKFTENKNLNPLKVSISTSKGVVTLKGYVSDQNAFIDALRIAKHTRGVQSVNANNLHIKQVNTVFTDALITAEVETAVLKAKVLDDESIPLVGINAETTNGVVTLTGQVQNAESVAYIIKRVTTVSGVKKIISHLKTKEKG